MLYVLVNVAKDVLLTEPMSEDEATVASAAYMLRGFDSKDTEVIPITSPDLFPAMIHFLVEKVMKLEKQLAEKD